MSIQHHVPESITAVSVITAALSSMMSYLDSHSAGIGVLISMTGVSVGLYLQWRRVRAIEKQVDSNG